MPSFSQKSRDALATCRLDLQTLFETVVQGFDCSILEGHRTEQRQNAYYDTRTANGKRRTQKRWPDSGHNNLPSTAVDVVPYPIDWEDRERFHYFAGYVFGIAHSLNIDLRWGGDWNKDFEVRDNKFDDLPHWELVI